MVLVRLGGKRGLASMNTLDFVVVFLLAGAVETSIAGDDNSLLGGVVSGDDLQEIEHGELTPSGQFVLTLKPHEQSSTKADIAALDRRLERIESMLSARR